VTESDSPPTARERAMFEAATQGQPEEFVRISIHVLDRRDRIRINRAPGEGQRTPNDKDGLDLPKRVSCGTGLETGSPGFSGELARMTTRARWLESLIRVDEWFSGRTACLAAARVAS
jgi:hypothetical protein